MKKYSVIWFVAILLAFFGCKREDTFWNTKWELPIFEDSLLIADWIPSKNLTVDEAGWYKINWDTTLLMSLDTLLMIPDTTFASEYALPFQVNVPAGVTLLNQTQSQSSWIPDGMELKKIFIRQGKIHYHIRSDVDGDIQLKFEVLRASKQGEPLLIDVILPPGPVEVQGDFDISKYVLDLSGPNGNLTNDWTNRIIIRSADAGMGADVQMNDLVTVDLNFDDVKIEKAIGYLGQQDWNWDEQMNLGSGWPSGEFNLEDMSLNWGIENRMGTDWAVNLEQVQMRSSQNQVCNLSHPQMNQWNYITRAQMDAMGTIYPTSWSQTWNSQNSNIVQAASYLGGGVSFKGKMKLNPLGNVNAYNDYFIPEPFLFHANIDAPLRFNAKNIVIEKELALEISEDIQASGNIHLKITNAYPLDMEIVASVNGQILGQGHLMAGAIGADGISIDPVESVITLSCSKSQLADIEIKGGVHMMWSLSTPNYPAMVGLRPEYFALAKSIGNVEFELGLR
jgi:hypothetical protein